MTSTTNITNPPSLYTSPSFDSWEKSIGLWKMVTNLKPEKQGPALVLSLSVKDRETALELTEAELTAVTGVDSVIAKLKVLYKNDTIDTAYDAFEKFIYFKRDMDTSIKDYVNEFERRYKDAKKTWM